MKCLPNDGDRVPTTRVSRVDAMFDYLSDETTNLFLASDDPGTDGILDLLSNLT